MKTPTLHDIGRIAASIEVTGLAGVPAEELRRIAHAARFHGASPVLVDVLLDPAEPEVARLRAFGRLATVFGPALVATAAYAA